MHLLAFSFLLSESWGEMFVVMTAGTLSVDNNVYLRLFRRVLIIRPFLKIRGIILQKEDERIRS